MKAAMVMAEGSVHGMLPLADWCLELFVAGQFHSKS
jgi:hypothetical protein